MIDTVTPVFNPRGGDTTCLLAPDNTLMMYKSKNKTHAEQMFLDKNAGNLSAFPLLWINNSPCVNCSQKLVNGYVHETTRPTIQAAHFYRGTAGKEASLQCLANMVSDGFTLKAFDWNAFVLLVSDAACHRDIMTALANAKFVDKMNDMANTITTVYNYSTNGNTHCPYT